MRLMKANLVRARINLLRGKKLKLLIARFKKARFLSDKLRGHFLIVSEMDSIPPKNLNQILIPIPNLTFMLESHATKETPFSTIPSQEVEIHILGRNFCFVTFARKDGLTLEKVIILVAMRTLIATTTSA